MIKWRQKDYVSVGKQRAKNKEIKKKIFRLRLSQVTNKQRRQGESSNLFQYQFSNYTFYIYHTCKTNKSLHSVQINFSFLPFSFLFLFSKNESKRGWETNIRKFNFEHLLCLTSLPFLVVWRKFTDERKCGRKFITIFSFDSAFLFHRFVVNWNKFEN